MNSILRKAISDIGRLKSIINTIDEAYGPVDFTSGSDPDGIYLYYEIKDLTDEIQKDIDIIVECFEFEEGKSTN